MLTPFAPTCLLPSTAVKLLVPLHSTRYPASPVAASVHSICRLVPWIAPLTLVGAASACGVCVVDGESGNGIRVGVGVGESVGEGAGVGSGVGVGKGVGVCPGPGVGLGAGTGVGEGIGV